MRGHYMEPCEIILYRDKSDRSIGTSVISSVVAGDQPNSRENQVVLSGHEEMRRSGPDLHVHLCARTRGGIE